MSIFNLSYAIDPIIKKPTFANEIILPATKFDEL